jgi:chromosome segregation ATPase
MENNETNSAVETAKSEVNTQNTTNVEIENEIKRLKDALSKSNSENAEWKRKYNSKLTEDEQRKASEEEREAYTKSLEQKIAKVELSAELSKSISDEKVLNSVVDLIIDGNNIEAIKKINSYIDTKVTNAIKEHDAQLLKSNPVPPPISPVEGITKDQFDKMSLQERNDLFYSDRETYNKLVNQK